ncbi:MAG: VCBS repeat-containing protein, partial [Myxococcota bacterium]|nr:VCBS repeat-containing protein [Myxococcota bacterium]
MLFLILLDEDGYRISPEPELITLEVDGAVPSEPLLAPGGGGITSLIRTTPGTEPGEVRVFAADGRLIGTVPIQKRAVEGSILSLEHTSTYASLTPPSPVLSGPYTVHVQVRNAFAEVVGASATVEVELTGGEVVDSLSVWPEGYQGVTYEQLPGYDQVEIDVYADGHFIDHLVQEVDFIPVPEVNPEPEEEADVAEPESEVVEETTADPPEDTGPPPSVESHPVLDRDDGGCRGGHRSNTAPWWLLTLGAIAFMGRRRRIQALAVLGLLVGLSSPAKATVAVGLEDISTDLGLDEALIGFAAPAFFDVDGDGQREALWISREALIAAELTEAGELEAKAVQVIGTTLEVVGGNLAGGLYSPYSLVVLDGDRDGEEELVVIGAHFTVLKRTGPYELTAEDIPVPSLPAVSVRDSAVGDMNGDGWPDIVLATGVMATEYVGNLRGSADLVLMNLGQGRYELQPIQPERNAFHNGITLVDMDADGRLDVVESADSSQFVGPSRILLNRADPGDTELNFEIHPYSFDPGTNGMGAAIGDLNEDGYLDVYHTSIGLDSLSMGKADGSFDDLTVELGITHRWGSTGYRSQWTPTFADLN